MRRRVADATQEWRAIAQGPDVLFHVCSWPEKRGRWTEEDFYASGRSDWSDFLSHWRHYEPALTGTAVEIGCGAGRLTHVLAEFFPTVHALDVSEHMIERARAHSPGNVTFHQVDSSRIPVPDGAADAVFSVHVLQHLESPAAIEGYLREAYRVLRPGGTVMVHIMLRGREPDLVRRLQLGWRLWRSRRALASGREHTAVRMTLLSPGEVFGMLAGLGFVDVQLRVFAVRSNGFHHSFFLARRPT